MSDGIVYEEVARVPDRHTGGELVRKIGRAPDRYPDGWRWWAIVGSLGAVTWLERPGSGGLPLSGDFGVHFRDGADEECYLIGQCRFAPNAAVGEIIAEAVREKGAEDDELVKMGVVWSALTALYYGYLLEDEPETNGVG